MQASAAHASAVHGLSSSQSVACVSGEHIRAPPGPVGPWPPLPSAPPAPVPEKWRSMGAQFVSATTKPSGKAAVRRAPELRNG